MELLKAIAARDEAALAQLYDRYRVILFGLLMRILNNREEAEDVLQEVFLQVWRKAEDFDEESRTPIYVAGDAGTKSWHRSPANTRIA